MSKDPFNNLTPEMQARLDKWKANILPVKIVDVIRGKSPGNYVARKRDYGDDMNEFKSKEENKK